LELPLKFARITVVYPLPDRGQRLISMEPTTNLPPNQGAPTGSKKEEGTPPLHSSIGSQSSPSTVEFQQASPLLLIVEDDDDMIDLLSFVLEKSYQVVTAHNGAEGLTKALEVQPDLILSDLFMPELSGVDLVREIRAHSALSQVPILVLTATHDAEMRAALLRSGAQDYLTKPFAPDELLSRVAHHLDVSRAQATLSAAASDTCALVQDLSALATQVTARKRDLEASLEILRQSRALFHAVARDFAHASGVLFDRELRFTVEQGNGLIALGLPGRLPGRTPSEVFPAAMAALIEPHLRAVFRGVATTFEVPLPTEKGENQGENCALIMRAMPVRDEAGAITGGLAVAQDLHHHHLEEDEWQEFQARLLAQVEDAVNVIDQQHRVIYWNNAAARLYGVEARDVFGRPLSEIYEYDWLNEGGREAVLAELDYHGYWKGECVHRLVKDGREIPVDMSLSLLREPGGAVSGFLAVIRDITARKRTARFQRLLAEASASFASSLDYEKTLATLARLCVAELAEFCLIDMVGCGVSVEWPICEDDRVRRAVALHRDDDKKAVMEKVAGYLPRLGQGLPSGEAVATGRIVHIEKFNEDVLRAVSHDEEHQALIQSLNIQSYIVAPLVARGRVIGLAKLFNPAERAFDRHTIAAIEELMRRATLALENAHLYGAAEQARSDAEAASRAKDEFLAVVSHELRTPLTPILGWVSMLRDDRLSGAMDEAMRMHALEAIQQGAEAQSQIIDDLLDVSRIISGKTHLHANPLRLRTVVDDALELARPAAQKKGIQICTAFDTDLGLVEGDPRRLQQVVNNLLSNAIKFTPAGGRIDIELGEHDGQAQLIVSDTGIGIDAEFLPDVFDRFSQADKSASRHHGGLGLGLAIVRHLVELHGGTVAAQSEGKDTGATFVVSLPLLPRKQLPASAAPHVDSIPATPLETIAYTAPRAAALLPGLRLLIVDDEPATRDMLENALAHAGAHVETADSAMAARQILVRWKPDVLISDIGMPGEDGYAFIRFVRGLHPDDGGAIPAIALTAYAGAPDRDMALEAGYQRHIAKPVVPADLVDAVLALMQQSV
jgi:PAS domain S-box-containing protein